MNDFTLSAYKGLINTVIEGGYLTQTVKEFSESVDSQSPNSRNRIILRHDVDRRPMCALKMAELEAQNDIKSTYYFRHMPNTFKPDIIKQIASLGHEIGYHYETLAKASGNSKKAFNIFQNELENFRNLAEIKTVCMHGRPLSKWDNRDLWNHYSLEDLGIICEPYLTIDYSNILYFTDTGRSWAGEKYNLRDKVNNGKPLPSGIESTNQLSDFLKVKNNNSSIMLQTHPERWAYSTPTFIKSYCSDFVVNNVKRTLKKIRA